MNKALPQHIGIIMDGNRRWAKKHGLTTFQAHRRGYQLIKKVSQWCMDRGIMVLTVFAFSMENWNRPKKEVSYLMRLLRIALRSELNDLMKRNVRLHVLGRIYELSKDLQKDIRQAMERTKHNTGAILNVAINYGGRGEIVDAVKKIVAQGLKPFQVTDALISQNLYCPVLPDPDLVIRTSGELRTSGFLLWETAYSELYFCQKYWPDFNEQDLDKAITDYQKRQRRFGS